MKTKQRAVLSYPPEYDGELHIGLEKPNERHVKISMDVALRKGETAHDVIRRIGREMADQPLTLYREEHAS